MDEFRFYSEEFPWTPELPQLWNSPDTLLGGMTIASVRQMEDRHGVELVLQPGNQRAWFWVKE